MPNPLPANISISSGTIVRTIVILILFYFLYYVRDVVLVILTSILIASAVEPGTRWFVKRRIPRVPAVLLIYLSAATLFIASFYFLLVPLLNTFIDVIRTIPETSTQIISSSGPVTGDLLGSISNSFSLPSIINELNSLASKFSSGVFGTLDAAFGGIISFVLIVVLSFYLAVQEDGVGNFLRAVSPAQHEPYILDLWQRAKAKMGFWMQGQLMLGVIVGVLSFLGLTLIGVPNALLLAFLAGVFELIPIFGSLLAAVPAVLVGFLDGGLTLALVVVGLYLIIQQFESQLIYPLVVKKVVGVPPIISILALVIGAKLAGFLGIILSVPLAAVFMELLNDFEKSKAVKKAAK